MSISLYTAKKTWGQVWETGRQTTTDEAGRFELADVPRYHVHLNVQGDEVIPSSHDLAPDGPDEGLRSFLRARTEEEHEIDVRVRGEFLSPISAQSHDTVLVEACVGESFAAAP